MGIKGEGGRDEKNSCIQEWRRQKEGIFSRQRRRKRKREKKCFINEFSLYTANDWNLTSSPGPFVAEYFTIQAFTRLCCSQLYSLHSQFHLFVHEEGKNISRLKITLANQKPASELNILPNMGILTLRPDAKHSEHKATTRTIFAVCRAVLGCKHTVL